jgi:hypothetical protein
LPTSEVLVIQFLKSRNGVIFFTHTILSTDGLEPVVRLLSLGLGAAFVSCGFHLEVVYCVSQICAMNRSVTGELSLLATVQLALCTYLRVRLLEST